MDLKDIQSLIKFVARAGVAEVKYKTKDFEINIKTPSGEPVTYIQQSGAIQPITAAPQVQPTTAPEVSATKETANEDSKYVAIKAPMIGTFYRRPSADKDVFVNVGDTVSAGQAVCIIEAMKLFNQIESEVSGKIVKILADDATPVEYDQPLFLVDPS